MSLADFLADACFWVFLVVVGFGVIGNLIEWVTGGPVENLYDRAARQRSTWGRRT